MSSLTAAAVAPPLAPLRLRRRGARNTARPRAPPRARRGAVSTVTNVLSSVVAGDAELAAEDDGAARPLTAVIVGAGLGGLAACGRA